MAVVGDVLFAGLIGPLPTPVVLEPQANVQGSKR